MTKLRYQSYYVAGHTGLVGSAVIRQLHSLGVEEIIVRPSRSLDLRSQPATQQFFQDLKPECVIFAAARVGGILANDTYPAQFIYDNLVMATNSIHAAFECGCKRFIYLGSTCIYPSQSRQPMPETCLLSGKLEKTNEAYAIAKIAGLKMCQYYRHQYGVLFHAVMPSNLYGPNDNYHPQNSHVIPGLIQRIHRAKESSEQQVAIWGSGKPRRDFLHVDDLASALIHLLQIDDPPDLVNIGSGQEVSIEQLTQMIAKVLGFQGDIAFDLTKPDGTYRKLADNTLIMQTGWSPRINLQEGIKITYADYLKQLGLGTIRNGKKNNSPRSCCAISK